jgi:hypothetical protein
VASVPKILFDFNFVGNATLICYSQSHVFEFCHIFDGFVSRLYDFAMRYGDDK